MWAGEICADDSETGIDAEVQNICKQPIRSLKEAKAFVGKYLASYSDVEIVKIVKR